VIGENVRLGDRVSVGSHCVIAADSSIGDDSVLHARVTVYHGVKIGKRARVHSNTVLGADGFGFARDGAESVRIRQLGSVVIGDDVDIGAGTTIDRGAIDDTLIANGVKIDNQVQVGHNCVVGENTILCGCVSLAGSVTIGKNCIMGGRSGSVGHIEIVDGVQVSAMSLVSKSITEPGMYSSGTGHMKTREWKRNIVRFQQLDEIARRLKKLEKQLADQ
jgi:UDP-3-O-[3-hydroxymyristoyl] glucosamine N-acyltransferase